MKLFFLQLIVLLICPLLALAQSETGGTEVRYVASSSLKVHERPDKESPIVGVLKHLDRILVVRGKIEMTEKLRKKIEMDQGVWVKVLTPYEGYIFQKRLISNKQKRTSKKSGKKEISAQEALAEITGEKVEKQEEPEEEYIEEEIEESDYSFEENSGNGNVGIWYYFGIGIFTIPEETGYSGSIAGTMDFFADYTNSEIPWMKLRGGLNMTESKGGDYDSETRSFYAAYRHQLAVEDMLELPEMFADARFEALGGIALMQSSLTSGASGSGTGFGFLVGLSATSSLSETLRIGSQFLIFSGQSSMGSISKYVGSNQLQIFVGSTF